MSKDCVHFIFGQMFFSEVVFRIKPLDNTLLSGIDLFDSGKLKKERIRVAEKNLFFESFGKIEFYLPKHNLPCYYFCRANFFFFWETERAKIKIYPRIRIYPSGIITIIYSAYINSKSNYRLQSELDTIIKKLRESIKDQKPLIGLKIKGKQNLNPYAGLDNFHAITEKTANTIASYFKNKKNKSFFNDKPIAIKYTFSATMFSGRIEKIPTENLCKGDIILPDSEWKQKNIPNTNIEMILYNDNDGNAGLSQILIYSDFFDAYNPIYAQSKNIASWASYDYLEFANMEKSLLNFITENHKKKVSRYENYRYIFKNLFSLVLDDKLFVLFEDSKERKRRLLHASDIIEWNYLPPGRNETYEDTEKEEQRVKEAKKKIVGTIITTLPNL